MRAAAVVAACNRGACSHLWPAAAAHRAAAATCRRPPQMYHSPLQFPYQGLPDVCSFATYLWYLEVSVR